MRSFRRGLDWLPRNRWASARAPILAYALALGACIGVLGLVHIVSAIGIALRLSAVNQALVFVAVSALPFHRHVFRNGASMDAVAVHFLICIACTYLALCLLARTVAIPVNEVATLTLAAFAEELTFRLGLPGFLSQRLSILAHGAMMSAVLAQSTFAIAHVANYAGATSAAADLGVLTLNGLLLSVIVRRAGLGLAGTSHAVFNATGSLDLPELPSQRTMQWTLLAAGISLLRKTVKGPVEHPESLPTLPDRGSA